jgi:1-deoxy-D-xylulose-5-phosphate synthase
MADVERALEQAKDYGTPVIVHAITENGRGYEPARANVDDQFHAIGAFDPITGEETKGSGTSWTSVFSQELVAIADENEKVVGITAAMLRPTGLAAFADKYPSRVVDVGIAEQHATTSAAGLAFGGLHPVVAVYATFMGRAFDQVLMDVALHKAGVTFVLDRAGVTGPDGASHHGQWDLAMLNIVPGVRIAAPRDDVTLREELREAIAVNDAPTVIRFPKGNIAGPIPAVRRTSDGVDVLFDTGPKDVLLVAIGALVPLALSVAEELCESGIGVTVVDPRWVIPVPASIVEMSRDHRLVVSLEDGIRVGGIGTRIRQDLRAAGIDTGVDELGLPDEFLEHDSRDNILRRVGLDVSTISAKIRAQIEGTQIPKAKRS